MSPQVVASFWMCVKESGLLSREQLTAFRRDPANQSLAPEAAAERLIERGLLSRFQAERLLDGRSRGLLFDRYKIVDILGVGGMGSVYQAEDTATGELVALKVLRDSLKHDDGMRARFLQEARIGLRLVHPHIVRTLQLGSAGGLPYMTMDLVRGPSLLEVLLRLKRLSCSAACEIVRQAALGLDYAHRQGFVHRDVKPQNLLIDADGQVHVLDFGLAMTREGETGDEFSMAMIFGHQCVGTAEYAAPEQSIDGLTSDARSDIYSLGATLYAALTGTTPFQAATTAEMLKAHHSQTPRSVREYARAVPPEVADIVARMLAKSPSDRYVSAADVAQALAPWARPVPVEFDFEVILAERKAQAQERQSQLAQRNPPLTPGIASSTARPAQGSSVAQNPAVRLTSSSVSGGMPDVAAYASEAAPNSSIQAARLGVLTSLITGDSFNLSQDRIVIGRSRECQLQVDDPAVSSRHCELQFDGFHWWVADLDSRNGTSVNGVSLLQQHELHSGDEIVIGSRLRFRIRYGGAAANPTSDSPRQFLQRSFLVAAAVIVLMLVCWLWWT